MPLQRILFFIFCTCISSKLISQVSENATVVTKCVSDILSYTAPAGATNINWSFGPSYNGSSAASGQFALTNTGTFSAIFSGMVGGTPKTFTVLVKVQGKPVANFSIAQPASPCAIKSVTLTDQSTSSSTITSWYWIYGDGNANTFSTGGSHVYGYTNIGNWSVTLIVTDANGCDAEKTIGTINVTPGPTAAIVPPYSVGCSTTSVAFSGSNSIGASLSYSWSFGNGQTSQQMNSTQNFTPQVSPYTVTLTVTSSNCSHSTTALVYATPPPTLTVTIPSTICISAAPIATLQSDQPSTLWKIDNGAPFLVPTPVGNPTVQLAQLSVLSAGLHTLVVTAGTQTCIATITKTLTVEQVVPSFSGSSPTVSCASPFIVSYNNTSSPPGTTASWSYKDADSILHTGTGNSPSFSLTLGSKNKYALFYRPFIPNISMTVTSVAGCTAAVTKTVHSLAKPTAWFYMSDAEGCAPLPVTFENKSWVYPSGPIISYTWDSGTGVTSSGILSLPPSTNSVVPPFNHVYTTPGVYHPSLTIQTANNFNNIVNTCTDVSWDGTVTVVNPPIVNLTVPSGPFCPDQVVQITNTSPAPYLNNVQNWHVTSDNKRFSHCLTDKNPGWKFTHVGSHMITLTGYYHDCPGSASAGPIIIKGPIVDATYNTDCQKALRTTVDFTLDLQEVSQATLSFGDNTQQVIPSNPNAVVRHVTTHVYPNTGDFIAVLTGENNSSGCPLSIKTMTVKVRDAHAEFVLPPSTGCVNMPLAVNASASKDVRTGCAMGYNWFIDNLPPVVTTTPNFSPVLSTPGQHTLELFVKDLNGCVDSAEFTFRLSEVKPQFSISSTSICLSTGTVQLTNTTPHLPDPIVMFHWDFGNTKTLSTTSMTVPIVQFTRGAVPDTIYTIQLTAVNDKGCSDKVSHQVLVKRPPFSFSQSNNVFCVSKAAPTTVTFTPQLSYPSYSINFGASATSTAIGSGPISYPYSDAGVFLVSIKVKDIEGCENTGTLSVLGIQTPTADFNFASPANTGGNNFCAGKPVTFTNVSNPEPTIPTWRFGSQSLGTNTNNVVSGNFSGGPATTLVAVGLTVTTGAPAYCIDSVSKSFNVYNYAANFLVSDTLVCLGSALTFSLVNDFGLAAYLWSYGDASTSSTLIPPGDPRTSSHIYPTYIPNTNGYVNAALVFWSTDMACRDVKDTLIKVINVAADFNRNFELNSIDTAHCINVIDKFQNLTTTNGTALSYTWSFGDGGGSDSLNPYHMYTSAGVYQVTLTARESHNCVNSTVKNMIIYPLPTATILAAPSGYCPGVNFEVSMEGSPGVVSGTWSPASSIIGVPDFTTSTATHTVTAFAPETSTFGIQVTSEFGCVSEGTDTTVTIIVPPKPFAWDTSVVIGEPVQLPDYIPEKVTFTWTPIFANLNCTDCEAPVSTTTVDIVYTVVMEDLGKCSTVSNSYSIHILPKSSIDVPSAFTPNGDGANDVIYVAGWGIKSLHYFRVYNRWGQLMFETDDINQGWDGNCKGAPQNTETYVYQVSVETFIDNEPLIKSGTFKLLR